MANELTTTICSGGLASLEPGHYLCTLDPAHRANRQSMAIAVQQSVPSLMEAVNLEIDVSDILLHKIDVLDEKTGEVKRLMRCVLFAKDGKMWSFCGAKPLKDLLLPAQLFGMALPYNPPQRFRVRREQAKGKQAYYVCLDWIDTDASKAKGR